MDTLSDPDLLAGEKWLPEGVQGTRSPIILLALPICKESRRYTRSFAMASDTSLIEEQTRHVIPMQEKLKEEYEKAKLDLEKRNNLAMQMPGLEAFVSLSDWIEGQGTLP